ncbi:MAG TPA: hypothetical protein PLT26_04275 [Anaerolineaceae bacterium]|nr:hypothetical protein [Anaerolineaceae bacterium]HQH84572.1 hypothetical protein [Anaerolineaceae bacterium]
MPVQKNDTILRIRVLLFLSGIVLIVLNFLMDALNPFSDQSFGRIQLIILLIGLAISLSSFNPKIRWELILARALKIWNWTTIKINTILGWIYRKFGLEILAVLSISWLYFRNVIQFNEPVGYAGLYALMTNLLIENHFCLPTWVPYYGPGGIPFAYPPVGFYLAGFAKTLLSIPTDTYLRFAPPVWTLLAVVALYWLALKMTGSRIKALLSAFLFGATLEIYNYHATAAGIVRAPALLWTILSLIGLWMVLRQGAKSIKVILLTAVCVGLTAATHLSYLVFLVLSAGVLLISKIDHDLFVRVRRLALILVLGALICAPWWVTIIQNFGITVLGYASSTHGSMHVLSRLFQGEWAQALLSLFSRWGGIPFMGFVLLGIAYALWKRNFILPVWFFVIFLLLGESDRFQMLLGGLMAGDAIVDLASISIHSTNNEKIYRNTLHWILPSMLIILFVWGQVYSRISLIQPSVTPALKEAAGWIQVNTDASSRVLFYSSEHDTAEWVPYLTERVPSVGHWGAEWLGTFKSRYIEWTAMSDCVRKNSLQCIVDNFADGEINYDYVLVPYETVASANPFDGNADYQKVFHNDQYLVYRVVRH